MILRFAGFAHTREYRSSALPGVWRAGEAREIPEDVGHGLMRDFPGAFEVVTPAISEPPADRMIRTPKRRA